LAAAVNALYTAPKIRHALDQAFPRGVITAGRGPQADPKGDERPYPLPGTRRCLTARR
jgi:hypothetical protein